MRIHTLLLFVTVALLASACATTGAFDSATPMSPTVATVSASSMLMPAYAHVFTRDAILAHPSEAGAITHGAVTAAPDRAGVITSAALSAAPQEAKDIKAAARRAAWNKSPVRRDRPLTWAEVQRIVDAAE